MLLLGKGLRPLPRPLPRPRLRSASQVTVEFWFTAAIVNFERCTAVFTAAIDLSNIIINISMMMRYNSRGNLHTSISYVQKGLQLGIILFIIREICFFSSIFEPPVLVMVVLYHQMELSQFIHLEFQF